jgi:hypothetical protein
MLSYSTGTSGSGSDVEKVRAATHFVHSLRPDILVAGPIQYDAAVDPRVAATKLPDSQVAGRATVLIFPDLNTGNNTYKAVQRSANAVAIGPVLQGLNRPVNDLSRGALVADIVNTVAATAVQAQGSVYRRNRRARERKVLHRDECQQSGRGPECGHHPASCSHRNHTSPSDVIASGCRLRPTRHAFESTWSRDSPYLGGSRAAPAGARQFRRSTIT